MSDNDFDTNGPGEEELRNLLNSLPRRQAPDDLEPEVMRRVSGMRRRRGLFGVFHAAARAEWIGGAISAAAAAMIVAGGWHLLRDADVADAVPSHRPTRPSVVATSPANVPDRAPRVETPAPVASRSHARPSAPAVERVAIARAEPKPAPQTLNRTLSAAPTRRSAGAAPAARHRARPVPIDTQAATVAIDTVTAARIATSRMPTKPTDAGESTHGSTPLEQAQPTGVGTGGR